MLLRISHFEEWLNCVFSNIPRLWLVRPDLVASLPALVLVRAVVRALRIVSRNMLKQNTNDIFMFHTQKNLGSLTDLHECGCGGYLRRVGALLPRKHGDEILKGFPFKKSLIRQCFARPLLHVFSATSLRPPSTRSERRRLWCVARGN